MVTETLLNVGLRLLSTAIKRIMKTFMVILLMLASTVIVAGERPNFIIVYVDDLGWADTSVPMMLSDPESKSDFNQTPNLEKLAAHGMIFSNAYAPAPTCTPSRKSIQFGKTPGRLGYTFVHDVLALQKKLSWKDEVSMADVLKAADPDYITAHFGKGMSGDRMDTIGYDITDEIDGNATNDNFHGEYHSIKDREPLPPHNPKRMATLQKSSVEFIQEYGGKRPFFMMVSHYAVHVPHAARADLIEKYRKLPRGKYLQDEDYLPANQISESRKISHWRLQYAAMLDEVDQGLGVIMDAVEKAGQVDNTFIIFTSDNGGGLNPNGALRGGKANLYEGGLRVPFVVTGPGVRTGVQCDVPVNQWDLLPTLHDYSESEEKLPEDIDGGSLRPVFEFGNDAGVERPVKGFVYHYPCYFAPPLTVIRLGDYKLMEHHLTGEKKLFNVATDYYEQQNLIRDFPQKAAELKAVMDRYLEEIDAEDVQDVYQARFAELDRFEKGAIEQHKKRIERAAGDKKQIAEANLWLQEQLERFDRNRKECRANMQGKTF
ncbi:MAG: sulfatase [Planctomycetaceae bacterium]|nr:sulfatase [Planctomycetaceae bacterium]|tara:strand:- start:5787 stop:7421 length:1635 start_codon:yes stop_codon:yes gene_type:complete